MRHVFIDIVRLYVSPIGSLDLGRKGNDRIASQRRLAACRITDKRCRDRASDYRSGGCAQEGVSSGDVHGACPHIGFVGQPGRVPGDGGYKPV